MLPAQNDVTKLDDETAVTAVVKMLTGSAAPAVAGNSKKKPPKKGRLKLHPANALVVQTLVPLSNCCNFEEDYAASARWVVGTPQELELI